MGDVRYLSNDEVKKQDDYMEQLLNMYEETGILEQHKKLSKSKGKAAKTEGKTTKTKGDSGVSKSSSNSKLNDYGRLPACTFAKLKKSDTIVVVFGDHAIKYKDQRWPVPERAVKYTIDLVERTQEAKSIVSKLNSKPTNEQLRAASDGNVRYYKIVTYENLPSDSKEIGFIEVLPTKKLNLFLNDKLLVEKHVNVDNVYKQVHEVIKGLATFN